MTRAEAIRTLHALVSEAGYPGYLLDHARCPLLAIRYPGYIERLGFLQRTFREAARRGFPAFARRHRDTPMAELEAAIDRLREEVIPYGDPAFYREADWGWMDT